MSSKAKALDRVTTMVSTFKQTYGPPQLTANLFSRRVRLVFSIRAEGKWKKIFLNAEMVRKQRLSAGDVTTIKYLSRLKAKVFEQMRNTDDPKALRRLNKSVTELDYHLQVAWGFPKTLNKHRWWEVPKCLCPKMDNAENWGTKYRIINENCPIHGKKV